MLSQTKTVVSEHRFDATWIDIKTGSVLLKKNEGDRPIVVRSTKDIVDVCSAFCPNEYFFCVPDFDLFEIYSVESPISKK